MQVDPVRCGLIHDYCGQHTSRNAKVRLGDELNYYMIQPERAKKGLKYKLISRDIPFLRDV